MSYPTAEQLTSWADTLTRTNWTKLASRLATAIDRDRRGGSTIPDGYPASTTGGSGGTAELTPTEAAANARIEGNARDEHHDRTTNAVGYLDQLMLSKAALETMLDRIEARAAHVDGIEPGCSHHLAHGYHEDRYRGDLCRDCYEFKLRYGCIPPGQLVHDKARGIRWTTTSIARALGRAQR